MNCKLDYIERVSDSLVSPDKKRELTEAHNLVMEKIATATYNGNLLFDIDIKAGKSTVKILTKFTNTLKGKELRKEQENFLQRIDGEIKDVLKKYGTPRNFVVGWENLSLNPAKPEYKTAVVTVNFSEYLESDFRLSNIDFSDPTQVDTFFDMMNTEMYDTSYIRKAKTIIDTLTTPELSDRTLDKLNLMLEKIDSLMENVINNKNNESELTSEESTISSMYYSLKGLKKELEEIDPSNVDQYNDKVFERILAINSYVVKSFKILDLLNKTIKNRIQPKISTLQDRSVETYSEDMREVSAILGEASLLLETIKPLQEILSFTEEGLGVSFWDSYNKLKVERDLLKLFPRKEGEVIAVLASEVTSIDQIKLGFLNKGFSLDEITEIISVIDSNLLENRNKISSAFNKLSSLFSTVQEDLRRYHFETLGTLLYNEQLRSQNVNSIDDITNLEIKNSLLTKEQLIAELKIASKDISSINKLFAGGSQIEDAVSRLYVEYIQNPIRSAGIENNLFATDAEEILSRLGFTLDSQERKDLEKKFMRTIQYIPKDGIVEEAEPDYEGPTITKYGQKFKVRESVAFIPKEDNSFDGHRLTLDSKLHSHTLPKRVKDLFNIFNKQISVASIPPHLLDDLKVLVANDLIGYSSTGSIPFYTKRRSINENIVKSVLYSHFVNSKESIKSSIEINEMLEKFFEDDPNFTSLDSSNMIEELNKKDGSQLYKFIKRNSYQKPVSESSKISEEVLEKTFGRSFLAEKIIGLDSNKNFVEVELQENIHDDYTNYTIKTPNIEYIFLLQKDFNNIKPKYKTAETAALKALFAQDSSGRAEAYYDFIMSSYKSASNNIGAWKLDFGLLPYIHVKESETFFEGLKKGFSKERLKKALENMKYVDEYQRVKQAKNEEGEWVNVDKDGNPTDVPVYIQRIDSYGDPYDELVPRYVSSINKEETEQDLFKSMFLYKTSSNTFKKLSDIESTAPILKTILKGSDTLGIKGRQAIKRSLLTDNVIYATGNVAATTVAKNSTEALLSFTKQFVYNRVSADDNILGLSAKKLLKNVKNLNVFQALSNNWIASMTNLGIGTISNYSMATGQRLGLTKEAINSAYSEYTLNIKNFLVDTFTQTQTDKSKYTQLGNIFDALKGNHEGMELGAKDAVKKAKNLVLFMSSTAPEHMNQMTMFIAFLKSHQILPGLTMNDIVKYEPGKAVGFDLEKYNNKLKELNQPEILEKDLVEKVLLPFHRKVDRIMYEANGQYSKMDTNMIERNHWTALAYLFQRWVYPGLKNRFRQGGEYIPLTGEVEQEGYLRTYLMEIIDRNDAIFENAEAVFSIQQIKDYILKNKIKTVKQLGKQFLINPILNMVNKVAKNVLKMDNPKIDDFLFGNANDEAIKRLERAYQEVFIYHSTFVLGMLISAIVEDDDEDDVLLKNLLLQSKRIHSDMGFFISPLTFADKLKLKAQDPFSIKRAYDLNSGLFKQLLFGPLEQYDRKGPGYEKGDYKVAVKARKAIFSPWHQFIKLMNPQQQINYMDLIFNE